MKYDDYEDASDLGIKNNIEAARDGDYHAGLRLIEIFAYTVKSNETPSKELLNYFSDAFKQILEDTDPNIALNISHPKHRPTNPQIMDRNKEIAFEVEVRISNGSTIEVARAITADEYNLSESTIKQAHEKYRDEIKHLAELLKDQIDN